MKNLISLSLIAVSLLAGSGCSKFRALTRRDYAFLSDPFARRADGEEEAPPAGAEPSTSGFVKIDDTEPKPVKANYAAVSQSKPAEVAQSAGFQGIRVRGMGDAISTEIGSFAGENGEATEAAPQPQGLLANSDFESEKAKLQTAASPGPEVAEALLPELPAMTAAKPKTVATSEPSEADPEMLSEFASFAASQKAKWAADVKEVEEKAAPLIRQPIQQVSDTVSEFAEVAKPDAEVKTVTQTEKATPLLLQQAVRQVERPESPLAAPIMPERPAEKPVVSSGEPMFEPPEDSFNPNDNWTTHAPSIAPPPNATVNPEPPVFDAPKKRPLIDGAKPVRENPFALIAQEAKVQEEISQPKIQPAPSFDDFKAAADVKWNAASDESKETAPKWSVDQKPAPKKPTIDSDFNFDDAWKAADPERP